MLIAQMIGRNESKRYLPQVLERLNRFVDKIVFTDDCSDDNTADIAYDYGAAVFTHTGPSLFERDEGMLRQIAWSSLEKYAVEGRDWILAIDCDELLYGYEYINDYINQQMFDVIGITFYNMWNANQYRVDKAWAPDVHPRLFRYINGGTFKRQNLACGSVPTYVDRFMAIARYNPYTDLRMKHLGYMADASKYLKYKKYMRIDGGRYHSRFHLESILDSKPELVDWQWDV